MAASHRSASPITWWTFFCACWRAGHDAARAPRYMDRARGRSWDRPRQGGRSMTDPLALDPVLPPRQRSERPWHEEDLPHDERFAHFEEHVTAGGKIEATDWMPD